MIPVCAIVGIAAAWFILLRESNVDRGHGSRTFEGGREEPPAPGSLPGSTERSATGAPATTSSGAPALRGLVICEPGERPLAGVRVRVTRCRDAAALCELESNDRGEFSVDVGVGTFDIELSRADLVGTRRRGIESGPMHVIRIARLGELVVRVLDPTSVPLAQARVLVYDNTDSLPAITRTDGATDAIPIRPGHWRVIAAAPAGDESLAPAWGTSDVPPGETRTIELTLHPGAELRGRLVDALSGTPIAGARVRAVLLGKWEESPAPTDAGGVFRIAPVRSGVGYHLHVDADGYASAVFAASSASNHAPREYPLERAISITYRLIGENGESVSGESIRVYSWAPDRRALIRSSMSDTEGLCLIDGLTPTASYLVVSLTNERQAYGATYCVPEDVKGREPVELRLLQGSRSLVVSVCRGNSPATGLEIVTAYLGDFAWAVRPEGVPVARYCDLKAAFPPDLLWVAHTGSDGTATIRGLRPGLYGCVLEGITAQLWMTEIGRSDDEPRLTVDLNSPR